MKNITKTFLFLLLFTLVGTQGIASEEKGKEERLPAVIVSASKMPQHTTDTGYATRVITGEEIEAVGAQTIEQVLGLASGVHIINAGGQRSLFMRGGASNQYVIKIDGVDLKDVSTPQATPLLNGVNVSDIERIEILEGSGSVLHGSAAMGGVINIYTKKSKANSGKLRITGSEDLQNTAFDYGIGLGKTTIGIGANRFYDKQRSSFSNTEEKDALLRENFYIRLAGDYKLFSLDAQFKRLRLDEDVDNSFGILPDGVTFGRVDDPNQKLKSNQDLSSIKVEVPLWEQLDITAQYAHAHTHRKSINTPDDVDPSSNAFFEFIGVVETFDIFGRFYLNDNTTILLGFDNSREKARENSIQRGVEANGEKVTQSSHAQYALLDWKTPYVDIQAGGRVENYSSKNVSTYTLLAQRMIPVIDTKIGVSTRSGHREPGLGERFSQFGGVTTLNAEESISREVFLSKEYKNAVVQVTLFESEVRNRISYVNGQYVNDTDDVDAKGVEYQLLLSDIGPLTYLNASYAYTDAKSNGVQATRVPEDKFVISGALQLGKVTTGFSSIYVGKTLDSGNVELESYNLVNLNFIYPITQRAKVNFGIQNLFNDSYEEISGFTTNKRKYIVGYSYEF